MSSRKQCVWILVAAGLLSVALSPPAHATLPVKNGRITFVQGGEILTINPDGSEVQQLTHLEPDSSAEAAGGAKVPDDLLGETTLPQYTVRGLCVVDPSTKKLTGSCLGSQGLHCVGKRDPVNCPAGQQARQPGWVQMCVYGRPYVDRGRSCNAF